MVGMAPVWLNFSNGSKSSIDPQSCTKVTGSVDVCEQERESGVSLIKLANIDKHVI